MSLAIDILIFLNLTHKAQIYADLSMLYNCQRVRNDGLGEA